MPWIYIFEHFCIFCNYFTIFQDNFYKILLPVSYKRQVKPTSVLRTRKYHSDTSLLRDLAKPERIPHQYNQYIDDHRFLSLTTTTDTSFIIEFILSMNDSPFTTRH